MNITSGIVPSAQKVIVYGPEGIGKSTFASKFPDPLFSDTEGSTKKLNIKRFDAPSSWEMLLQQAQYVRDNTPCKTYVIDTADWAEKLCAQSVCAVHKKTSIADFGYGTGFTYLRDEFGKLLNLLDEVIAKGVNVVITAHSYLRKFEQPDEMGAYDRYEMKLTKLVAPLVKEWADAVFFVNYKTYVVIDDKTKKSKAQGSGARVMYTTHHPCWDAKNRDGLAEELPFDFEQIKHILPSSSNQKNTQTSKVMPDFEIIDDDEDVEETTVLNNSEGLHSENAVIQKLYDLMKPENVTVEEIQCVVADKGYFPRNTPIENYGNDFIEGVLIGAWTQVLSAIKENYREMPF